MARHGGEKRGNSKDRARRKAWMLEHFGDGEQAPCAHCSTALTYATIEADRIEPGGSYRRTNIQPSCRTCNLRRSDRVEVFTATKPSRVVLAALATV